MTGVVVQRAAAAVGVNGAAATHGPSAAAAPAATAQRFGIRDDKNDDQYGESKEKLFHDGSKVDACLAPARLLAAPPRGASTLAG